MAKAQEKDTASIRSIDPSYSIRHEGQVLTGMQIFDRAESLTC